MAKTGKPQVRLNIDHRFFIRPATLGKLNQVANYGPYLTPVDIIVYSLPASVADERPDITEGMIEIRPKIKE